MKLAAVYAIADLVSDDVLDSEHIIPSPFDPRVAPQVAAAVAKAAMETGVARKEVDIQVIKESTKQMATIG
jgi:malate dehydrogenase (oxaloacetate-decarboxylating)